MRCTGRGPKTSSDAPAAHGRKFLGADFARASELYADRPAFSLIHGRLSRRSNRRGWRQLPEEPATGQGAAFHATVYKHTAVPSAHEGRVGIGDRRFGDAVVDDDVPSERQPVARCPAEHPSQRGLREKVAVVAAADVGMGAYEPALLDVGRLARREVAFARGGMRDARPQRRPEGFAVLIDGERMVREALVVA